MGQALSGATHYHRVRLSQRLKPGRHIRRFTKCQTLLPRASAHVANDDEPRVDTNTHREVVFARPDAHGDLPETVHDSEPGTDRSLGVVLMSLGEAEVDGQPITEVLRDVTVERRGRRRRPHADTRLDRLAQILRVETSTAPSSQPGREHDCELAALGFGARGFPAWRLVRSDRTWGAAAIQLGDCVQQLLRGCPERTPNFSRSLSASRRRASR